MLLGILEETYQKDPSSRVVVLIDKAVNEDEDDGEEEAVEVDISTLKIVGKEGWRVRRTETDEHDGCVLCVCVCVCFPSLNRGRSVYV